MRLELERCKSAAQIRCLLDALTEADTLGKTVSRLQGELCAKEGEGAQRTQAALEEEWKKCHVLQTEK